MQPSHQANVAQVAQSAQPGCVSKLSGPHAISRYLCDKNLQRTERDFAFLIDSLKHDLPEIEMCIRDESLNLYNRGNSLAQISFLPKDQYRVTISNEFYKNSRLNGIAKFASTPNSSNQAKLTIHKSELPWFFAKTHLTDLCKRIKDVNYCEEISTEQIMIVDNKNREDFIIMDRQIAFPGIRDIRMDLLALRQAEEGSNRYRFQVLEVKLGNNKELEDAVARQLDRYVSHIQSNFDAYKICYERQYEQKRKLRLIEKPDFDHIEIINGTTGVVAVTGYLGTAQPMLAKLKANHPDLIVETLSLAVQ